MHHGAPPLDPPMICVSFPYCVCLGMAELSSMCVQHAYLCFPLAYHSLCAAQFTPLRQQRLLHQYDLITLGTFCKQAWCSNLFFVFSVYKVSKLQKKLYFIMMFLWKYFWFCPQTRA